ncbi:MAG: uracil-DNA glycosylase [Candidatus Neomarinimicrobiota bacterium]
MNNFLLIGHYLKKYKKLFSNEIYIPRKFLFENQDSYIVDEKGALIQYECIINNCKECRFTDSKIDFFFGSGDPNADLLLVDEAPALEIDPQGLPFLGKAGKLLDKILLAIGLNRSRDVFIVNILKCKPPKNRDPLPSEIEKYIPYLQKQIKIIKPKLILALGKVAGKSLIRKDISLNEIRDTTFDYYGIPLRVTYHPEVLLRNENLKKLAWDDFKWVKTFMGK